jgi:hypothetical protein
MKTTVTLTDENAAGLASRRRADRLSEEERSSTLMRTRLLPLDGGGQPAILQSREDWMNHQ